MKTDHLALAILNNQVIKFNYQGVLARVAVLQVELLRFLIHASLHFLQLLLKVVQSLLVHFGGRGSRILISRGFQVPDVLGAESFLYQRLQSAMNKNQQNSIPFSFSGFQGLKFYKGSNAEFLSCLDINSIIQLLVFDLLPSNEIIFTIQSTFNKFQFRHREFILQPTFTRL